MHMTIYGQYSETTVYVYGSFKDSGYQKFNFCSRKLFFCLANLVLVGCHVMLLGILRDNAVNCDYVYAP